MKDSLCKGVVLEDRRALLPWGARVVHLLKIAAPDHQFNAPAGCEFVWNHPVLLGGLSAETLRVILFPYGWLDCATAHLIETSSWEKAQTAFEEAHRHLLSHLGDIIHHPPPLDGSPLDRHIAWQTQGVYLSLLLRRNPIPDEDLYTCTVTLTNPAARGMPATGAQKRTGWCA